MQTIVFSDLVNSTRVKAALPGTDLLERNRVYWETILRPHRERVTSICEQYEGRVVDQIGDSFLFAFQSVVRAAKFAVAVQKVHAVEPIATPLGRVQVRMGLHTGEPLPDPDGSGRLVGQEVDYGARLAGLAEGGQILLSNATGTLLGQAMMEETKTHPHGDRELKGIGRVPIFELLFAGKDPQPLREAALSPENLPPRPPRVTGREELLVELHDRLQAGGVLILKGEGGMGKTTLALQLGHDLHRGGDAPGGVVWINGETEPDYAECMMQAAAVFFGDRSEAEPLPALAARVRQHLTDRRAVLVIDNYETVAADPRLLQWLAPARPPARVLLTTREIPPGLAGRIVAIPELGRADAVRLFQARAADAGVSEPLDPARVVALCAAVGDHPLSVDLLAARAARLPLDRLCEQLQKGLAVLDARRDPTRPERHQSARACIAGSVADLSAAAAELFKTCSVLPTGFGTDVLAHLSAADFDDAVEELVAVSLWRFRGGLYSLHPLVRQYAVEQLHAGGAAAAERAVACAVARALDAQQRNVVPGPRFVERSRVYLRWCTDQLPNVVAAAECAERHGESALLPGLARGLEFFFNTHGHWPLAEQFGRKSLEAAERFADPAAVAFSHDFLGFVYRHQGRDQEAVDCCHRALAVYDAHPEAAARRPQTHARLGKELTVMTQFAEGAKHVRQALDGYRAALDRNGESTALVYLGQNTKFLKQWPAAVDLFREALIIAERLENVPLVREIHYQIGDTLIQLHQYAEAERSLLTSADLARQLGNEDAEAKAIAGLGTVALRRGEFDAARSRLTEAAAIHHRTGLRNREGRTLRRLAEVECAAGNMPAALDYARRAVEVLRPVEVPEAREKAARYLKELEALARGQEAVE